MVGEGPPEPIALGSEISNFKPFKPLMGEGPHQPMAFGSILLHPSSSPRR